MYKLYNGRTLCTISANGQLSRAAAHDPENITDPVAAGISASEEILKGLGMKKPPAILQYKMAQALGRMADGAGAASTAPNFDQWLNSERTVEQLIVRIAIAILGFNCLT